ncbi:hypothetical protein COCHEDRAFT_1034086 [Bipolaris maydis C5]|uniref:Uncharacterized protein n=1 Tax=Cochliobolus heterostrophus (strain C5 / ATCC 48332 / race O) TaxID=701091 RepID=M2UFV3_COCH5|nr:hypothetical protein COCHEDRAFT_1034086 [Bipolaris maydis C5]KAJ6204180.1 retinal pigment epithelial membrane protein-domain-containing protein [Bipolaris maydis]
MKTPSVAVIACLLSPLLAAAVAIPESTERADVEVRSILTRPAADVAQVENVENVEKRADCWIRANWYNNWLSGGFRRYGVRLEAGPDSRRQDLLNLFCAILQGNAKPNINNKACYSEPDGSFKADITTFEGSHGHGLYLDFFQQNFNDWRRRTNCDVDNRNILDFSNKKITSFSIDRNGVVDNQQMVKQTLLGAVHDIAITGNWIVFCQWPVSLNENGKPGKSEVVWDTERPAMFIVTPSHPEAPLEGLGWKPYEQRIYTHPYNSEMVHTEGAWEVDGKIYFEGTWPHHAIFSFWSNEDGSPHAIETWNDLVRIEIDPSQPTETQISDPFVLVGIPNEFCRIDERFHCRPTGELKIYYPGDQCRCQEPLLIPRSDNAPEGDGYVIFAVNRLDVNLTNIAILDTNDFETPVAAIELPIRMRAQIHGNWVDARELSGKPLVAPTQLHHMNYKLSLDDSFENFKDKL